MALTHWKKQMIESIKCDYPALHSDIIKALVDVYEDDKDWVEDRIKQEKKKHGKGPIPPPKNNLTLDELELLHEKIKQIPQGKGWIEQTPEDEENKCDIIVNEQQTISEPVQEA